MAVPTSKAIVLKDTFVFQSALTAVDEGVNDAIGEGCWVDTITVDPGATIAFLMLRDNKTMGVGDADLQDYVFQCTAGINSSFTLNPGKGAKFETGLSMTAALGADGTADPTNTVNVTIVGRRL